MISGRRLEGFKRVAGRICPGNLALCGAVTAGSLFEMF